MYSRRILLSFFLLLLIVLTIVLICGVFLFIQSNDQYKVIETINGAVRGIRNTTLLKGITFYSFKGIPYAKSPIDDLRFKVK